MRIWKILGKQRRVHAGQLVASSDSSFRLLTKELLDHQQIVVRIYSDYYLIAKVMFSLPANECHEEERSQKEFSAVRECEENASENISISERSAQQLDKHKACVSSIKEHYLFPLLELMLKKCETATWSLSPDAFAMDDVLEMVSEMSSTNGSVIFTNSELDSLLFNAILMLRIHLIELFKVADLCNDFKTKYTQSLKKKMSQESVIGPGGDSDEDMGSSTNNSDSPAELNHNILTVPQGANRTIAMLTTANGMVSIPLSLWDTSSIHSSMFCPSTAEEGSSANCNRIEKTSKRKNGGEVTRTVVDSSALHSYTATFSDEDSVDAKRKCMLSTKAVDTLKSWLFLHASHPYPSEDQKALLSKETGLQMVQINNWFINARRRILPTRLDTSSVDDDETNTSIQNIDEWNKGAKRLRRDSKSNNHLHHSVTNFFATGDASPKIER
ncbi:Homeobox protein Meis3 [Toxocara canis]|uniref:Homeobox protein Meis3 n=1 Tax=Toxocara canis TaxID=6265 RepID=A0A0B2VIX0_TOXCA|nr:Homeobox protein Meis3 [Toxocara canis]